jgi:hypothetical protein
MCGIRGRLWLTRAILLGACWALCAACNISRNWTYPKPFASSPLPSFEQSSDGHATRYSSVTGTWTGVSSADCMGDTTVNPGRCHATQNITLTMLQQGDKITGYYTCAFGTEVCRNLDETGVIRDVTMMGRRLMLRVMLTDGSMCFFTAMPSSGVMEGRYSCLQGAGLVERGAFRTVRSY